MSALGFVMAEIIGLIIGLIIVLIIGFFLLLLVAGAIIFPIILISEFINSDTSPDEIFGEPDFKTDLFLTKEEKNFLSTYLKSINRIRLTEAEKQIIDVLLVEEFCDCLPKEESLLIHSIAALAIDCKSIEDNIITRLSRLSEKGIKKINGKCLSSTSKILYKKISADLRKDIKKNTASLLGVATTDLKSLNPYQALLMNATFLSFAESVEPKIKTDNTLKKKPELIDDLLKEIDDSDFELRIALNDIDKKILLLLLNKVQLLDIDKESSSKYEKANSAKYHKADKELLLLLLGRTQMSANAPLINSTIPIINCEAMSRLPLNEIYTLFTGENVDNKGCNYIAKGFTKNTSQRRKSLEIFEDGQHWVWKDFKSGEAGNIMALMRMVGLNAVEVTQA